MTVTTNGRPGHKQLSDQLDRLDGVIDGLCDRPRELLADPDLRAAVRGLTPPGPPAPPPPAAPAGVGFWGRIRVAVAAAATNVADRCRAVVRAAVALLPVRRAVVAGLVGAVGRCRAARVLATAAPVRRAVVAGIGAALAAGAGAWVAPGGGPVVVAGVCGAAATLIRDWVRSSVRAVGFALA